MQRGRLMLAEGSSASCEYEFTSDNGGMMRLPELMFTAHRETTHPATLELEDGSRKTLMVTTPQVGEAEFTVDR